MRVIAESGAVWAISMVFFLGGLVFLRFGSRRARARRQIGEWNTTRGFVVRREVWPHGVTQGRREQRYWTVEVEYRYSIEDREYSGTRLDLEEIRHATRERAQEGLRAIPEDPVVFYNPANPAEAFLRGPTMSAAPVSLIPGCAPLFGAIAPILWSVVR